MMTNRGQRQKTKETAYALYVDQSTVSGVTGLGYELWYNEEILMQGMTTLRAPLHGIEARSNTARAEAAAVLVGLQGAANYTTEVTVYIDERDVATKMQQSPDRRREHPPTLGDRFEDALTAAENAFEEVTYEYLERESQYSRDNPADRVARRARETTTLDRTPPHLRGEATSVGTKTPSAEWSEEDVLADSEAPEPCPVCGRSTLGDEDDDRCKVCRETDRQPAADGVDETCAKCFREAVDDSAYCSWHQYLR